MNYFRTKYDTVREFDRCIINAEISCQLVILKKYSSSTVIRRVLFSYPRCFEMLNDVVEAFFDGVVGVPFEKKHETSGVHTLHIKCTYHSPGKHGDQLKIQVLCCTHGETGPGLKFLARCGETDVFTVPSTPVHIDKRGRSASWPNTTPTVLQDQVAADLLYNALRRHPS